LALYDTTWYTSSVAYAAVTARPQNTAVAAGVVRRQFTAPAVNSERCFVCIVAGTTANVTDATWTLTRGAKTTDGTATWIECTGMAAVNGDAANTPTWTAAKAAGTPTQGAIIKRANGASYWIASTAGTLGATEPAWPNDTAGTTQADGTTTWTCLGVVGNFPAWGAPHARLTNAYTSTWGAAGHKFWIADNHAETQAANLTLNQPCLSAAITTAICVDRTAALPPAEANYNTGASISTTGNFNLGIGYSGSAYTVYYQGIAFSCGSGSSSSAFLLLDGIALNYKFVNCSFTMGISTAGSTIQLGSTTTPNTILWDNCKAQLAATGQSITLRNTNFEWRNSPSAIQGATLPTNLFFLSSTNATYVVCRGVDFSAFSGQLVTSSPTNVTPLICEDCKFHANMTRYGASTAGYASSPVITVRCDSGATNYKSTRDEYAGTQTTETSITRVGGATDGTTPSSDKIVTNAQAAFLTPYRMLPLAIWNETIGGNVTVTVYGTVNSASLPNNDELWMDVQYLGSSGSPLASFKSTSKTHPLAAAAAVASDSSTWNGMPASTTLNGVATNVTLSNGNLTASHLNTSPAGVASASFLNSSKYYFEATIQTSFSGNSGIGIVQDTASVSSGMISNAGSAGLNLGAASSKVYANAVYSGKDVGGLSVGDVIGEAVDLTARLIWCRRLGPGSPGYWNNDPTADPATGVGGISFAAGNYAPFAEFANAANNTDAVTFNFGQSAYAAAAPSGFGNWAVGWFPFKLVAVLTSPQPQMKGFIYVNVRAAKASATYYIDPLPALT
jgi:hypothetical protein